MAKPRFVKTCGKNADITPAICRACGLNCEHSMYKIPVKEIRV